MGLDLRSREDRVSELMSTLDEVMIAIDHGGEHGDRGNTREFEAIVLRCAEALEHVAARPYIYLAAFFAGFCCLANGLYLAAGSVGGVGDAGDLLRHGAARWQLWLFGVPTSILGLWLWNGLGPHFGFRPANGEVDSRVAVGLGVGLLVLVLLELLMSA